MRALNFVKSPSDKICKAFSELKIQKLKFVASSYAFVHGRT